MINRIEASVKFNTTYICTKCGKTRVGSTVRTNFKGSSAIELQHYINSIEQSSHYMPIGWGRRSNWDFNCDNCIKSLEKL